MEVNDIILNCAILLDEKCVEAFFKNNAGSFHDDGSDGYRVSKKLLDIVNLVMKEMYLKYYTEIAKESAPVNRTEINFSMLNNIPLEVLAVYDENNQSIPFKVEYETIYADKPIYKVEFTVAPKKFNFESKINATEEEIPFLAMCYAVVSEYLLTQCRFDEAVFYRQRFIENMPNKIEPVLPSKITNYNIKKREWC